MYRSFPQCTYCLITRLSINGSAHGAGTCRFTVNDSYSYFGGPATFASYIHVNSSIGSYGAKLKSYGNTERDDYLA